MGAVMKIGIIRKIGGAVGKMEIHGILWDILEDYNLGESLGAVREIVNAVGKIGKSREILGTVGKNRHSKKIVGAAGKIGI